MKIVTLAATNHRNSINQLLVRQVASHLEGESQTDLDLTDYPLPIYSQDLEEEIGIPEPAHQLLEQLRAADLLLIAFAEHNGSYTAVYKNAFDWMSRIEQKVYDGIRVATLAASPGPGGASSVLAQANQSMPFFGAELVFTRSVASFNEHLSNGRLDDTLTSTIASDLTETLK
ncbi:MAG: NAD(P)H-dependent oxidoreductase [Gammaproteobacteria bacterium]|nr:NAD(P)H-dependent oxidoreductase [Gammaproteobacteria bacterium]